MISTKKPHLSLPCLFSEYSVEAKVQWKHVRFVKHIISRAMNAVMQVDVVSAFGGRDDSGVAFPSHVELDQ